METFTINTNSTTEYINITSKIKNIISKTAVKNGLCHIFVPHTTAGVTINENADPAVTRDIIHELNKVIPFQDDYHHMEGNSAAHIKTTLTGNSEFLIINKGNLVLGTWQSVYFAEYDGPRTRRVYVEIIEK